jgi:hypothetical protein
MNTTRAHRRPQYFRMLWSILIAYALMIGFGGTHLGDPARVVLLVYLLWTSARLHSNRRWRRWALGLSVLVFAATGWMVAVGSPRMTSGVIGASSVLLIGLSIAAIVSTLLVRFQVDAATVLGVLCIYLLFALFFASVHQIFASFQNHYLNGVQGRPTPSDLLYFSVSTLSTVGFGDITPASQIARAVSVVEALTGQLYLVSVVAGVVASWPMMRSGDKPDD